MTVENRIVTKDYLQNEIVLGSVLICINDTIGGDNDNKKAWDIVKGVEYRVSNLFDDDNLLEPMVVIEGSKNGPFLADRFVLKDCNLTIGKNKNSLDFGLHSLCIKLGLSESFIHRFKDAHPENSDFLNESIDCIRTLIQTFESGNESTLECLQEHTNYEHERLCKASINFHKLSLNKD